MASLASRARNYSPNGRKVVPAETPYLRARQERANQIASAIAQARNWRLTAWGLGALLAGAIAWSAYLGAQSKTVPYVIEVDRLGRLDSHGLVATAAPTPSQFLISVQLRQLIERARTVSTDVALMKRDWTRVYAMLTPPAKVRMTEWAGLNQPIERAEHESVTVSGLTATPQNDRTWQLEWREQRWGLSGEPLEAPSHWKALITTTVIPPKSPAEIAENPLGLFVSELHWDRVPRAGAGRLMRLDSEKEER